MAVENRLARRQPQKLDFAVYVTQNEAQQQINKLLGGPAGTRFISSLVSAVQANPALQVCTNGSLLSAALQGEALKLSPSPQLGQYYMVPYENTRRIIDPDTGRELSVKINEAQFQIGYKGYIQLAIRSGQYKKLTVLAIKEGELEYFDPLNEEIKVNLMIDRWDEREAAETVGYYAMFELVNGFRKAIYWSRKQMLSHADQFSKAFHVNAVENRNPKAQRVSYEDFRKGKYPKEDAWKYSSFWYKNFDDMAYKTMLRQLISKWGPMSVEMQEAFDADMAVIREDGLKDYVEHDGTADMPDPAGQEPAEPSEAADEPAAGGEVSGAGTASAPEPQKQPESGQDDLAAEFFAP